MALWPKHQVEGDSENNPEKYHPQHMDSWVCIQTCPRTHTHTTQTHTCYGTLYQHREKVCRKSLRWANGEDIFLRKRSQITEHSLRATPCGIDWHINGTRMTHRNLNSVLTGCWGQITCLSHLWVWPWSPRCTLSLLWFCGICRPKSASRATRTQGPPSSPAAPWLLTLFPLPTKHAASDALWPMGDTCHFVLWCGRYSSSVRGDALRAKYQIKWGKLSCCMGRVWVTEVQI